MCWNKNAMPKCSGWPQNRRTVVYIKWQQTLTKLPLTYRLVSLNTEQQSMTGPTGLPQFNSKDHFRLHWTAQLQQPHILEPSGQTVRSAGCWSRIGSYLNEQNAAELWQSCMRVCVWGGDLELDSERAALFHQEAKRSENITVCS